MGGTTWVPRQLSHEVIASIDAETITVNQLVADQIHANAITGEKIIAGAIDGKTITGALIQTSALANRGVKSEDSGIKAWSPSGTQTFHLDAATGDTTIGGNAAITGTLSLPAGIINNAALTNQIIPGIVNFTDTAFSIDLAWANVATTTVTVPLGCNELLATCSAEVYGINPNTSGGSDGTGTDLLSVRVALIGQTSASYGLGLSGSNGYTTSYSAGSFHFTGLTPGAVWAIAAQAHSLFQDFGPYSVNKATITATLMWLR